MNPGSIDAFPRIDVTRSSDGPGDVTDLVGNRKEKVCGTLDKKNSWWCVDLTKSYTLYLTHYSLRQAKGRPVIRNWRLQGSLDGRNWETLRDHVDDRRLGNGPAYRSATWEVDGKMSAFRYFKIMQTGKNSEGKFSLFLAGMELYGVLIEKNG